MFSLKLIPAALLVVASAAYAQTSTYQDPKTGVTFQYPSVWVPYDKAPSYMGPAFASATDRPRASFTFTSDGNIYKRTLLLSLIFSYFVTPAADSASCLKLAKDAAGDEAKSKTLVIHGVRFQEIDGGDAGMCHEQSSQIAVTYRNNQCSVFERDFNTECYGADDSKRNLTTAEFKALQRHLDEIMQSVVFAPLKP